MILPKFPSFEEEAEFPPNADMTDAKSKSPPLEETAPTTFSMMTGSNEEAAFAIVGESPNFVATSEVKILDAN